MPPTSILLIIQVYITPADGNSWLLMSRFGSLGKNWARLILGWMNSMGIPRLQRDGRLITKLYRNNGKKTTWSHAQLERDF